MYKTPFIIAANKIDKISGYSKKDNSVVKSISMQKENVLQAVENGIYNIVGQLYELGINSERFDRVSDYTKQIAIVPCSALSGEGIAEILMLISGLAQKFLECDLTFSVNNLAKGTILEVREVKGLGVTIDVILFDGTLKVGDTICLGGLNGPIVTKVKALLMPTPLSEIRDKKAVFKSVRDAVAATGVKISAPLLDEAMAGTPIYACKNTPEDIDDKKSQVLKEIDTVFIETQKSGVIVKADSLGSLEALVTLLKEERIPIRKASVGDITKNDFLEAEGMLLEKPEFVVILGFNVGFKCNEQEYKKVKVINNEVIYRIIEEYKKWSEETKKSEELKKLGELASPCKIRYLVNHTFRQSNPAIIGVEIVAGTLKVGTRLMKENGSMAGVIKGIQIESESLKSADAPSNVAVSINDVCCGRQINEGEVYYSVINEEEFKKLKNAKELLTPAQIDVLKEIALIMRKSNEIWGV
jgi:translation initiation factor 5B